ncbi:MAG: cytochrome c [Chloroflexota bacterium]|nr:cytochrome c [Chloroflexota bacterium]
MPSRTGIPQSFGIIMVFALMAAGIFALVGFAVYKGADRNVVEAKAISEVAGAEGWETGLFCIEDGKEDHPSLSLTERPPETCAEAAPLPIEIIDEEAVRAGGNALRGAELYVANGCQVCHGEMGEGIVGPTIARTGLDIQGVISQYRQPRGIMQEFSAEDVSVEDIADIWTWLQTLPAVDPLIDPNNDALGHENYGQWAE